MDYLSGQFIKYFVINQAFELIMAVGHMDQDAMLKFNESEFWTRVLKWPFINF